MDISYEDVQNILKIIDGSSIEELHLEIGDLKLIVRRKWPGGPPDVQRPAASDDETQTAAQGVAVPICPGVEAESVMVAGVKEAAAARLTDHSRPVREGGVEVRAPVVGTVYRAPAPGAPPFVEVGNIVTEDDTVCIIEVMKLVHSIKAGCRGRVVEICAENGKLVEFDQTLMVIEPLL